MPNHTKHNYSWLNVPSLNSLIHSWSFLPKTPTPKPLLLEIIASLLLEILLLYFACVLLNKIHMAVCETLPLFVTWHKIVYQKDTLGDVTSGLGGSWLTHSFIHLSNIYWEPAVCQTLFQPCNTIENQVVKVIKVGHVEGSVKNKDTREQRHFRINYDYHYE